MKTAINQDDVRRANDVRVMSAIMKGPLTRRELQDATGLSWGGITNTVNRLIGAGYIVEKRCPNHGCGRTPALAALNESDHFVIGIDVNHTGLTGCVTALTGLVICERAADADFSSPAALMDCIERFISELVACAPGKHIMALGVSMQGEVDTFSGMSLKLPQCPGWENIPIKQLLAERFGMQVFIAHDPDCMLHAYMAEAGAPDAVLMRLDRSAGMAAALNGSILRGAGILEAAHMVIDPRGPMCNCGMRGCLNAYVAECAKTGKYEQLAEPLAITAHNMIQLFRPKALVLAGALMEKRELFMDSFRKRFAEISCHSGNVMIDILADARSAMRGAAMIAAEGAVNALNIRENI